MSDQYYKSEDLGKFGNISEFQKPLADKFFSYDLNTEILSKRSIIVGQHCYGCTAGSGSSCGGAVV